MNVTNQETDSITAQEVCTIVVLYDGNATRARAMAACNYLVQQFWADIELKFHWWRTDFFREAPLAAVAADNAVAADFLILACENAREISPALESWFERWLPRRKDRQGALVDLRPANAACANHRASQREQFLRDVCQRGNFDYLAAIADETSPASRTVPAADDLSEVIDDARGASYRNSHYGLNE